jgi:SAM-dependent methyltransferase
MTSISSKRKTCRLCDSDQLTLVLPINASPIADAFVSVSQLSQVQPLVPLDLYQCQACGHVQNLDIVNPELLFRDYIFTTSSSAGLVSHFRSYAADVVKEFAVAPGSLVAEIGSNDGTLLKFFRDAGMKVVGIDPAREIAKQATEEGIPTIPEYFDVALSAIIQKQYGKAKLIVANNVYAHADQLGGLTDGIANLLDTDGVFVFEVSYLMDIIDKFVFDTVYHEHLSYHSVKPFVQFFAAHGLHLFNVQTISTKGGSMRGFVQKAGGPHLERSVVKQMIIEEDRRGLHLPQIFKEYESKIVACKSALLEYMEQAKQKGLKIAAYGASTTVTTLMYHFELTDKLAYLIDDNTKKHGMFSPGCHLEVKPSSILLGTDRPDVVVILAWQYAEVIMRKNAAFIEAGGCFVVPLPELKIYTSVAT